LTVAVTPSSLFSLRSIRFAHDAHVMPSIDSSTPNGPLVKLAFELYATGDYTLDELADELYDRGLRTRPTNRHPAKKVSIHKLSDMLRDRYYLGYVDYKGEEIRGRHEPLIDDACCTSRSPSNYANSIQRRRT
jgi:hypothetical protein